MSESILFYNSANGAGAIGVVKDGEFLTRRSYAAGLFATNWTHIADVPVSGGRVLFYDQNSGAGAVGHLLPDIFVTTKGFPGGSFSNWTQVTGILAHGHGRLLFYNANTGAGAVGFDPTEQSFPAGSFSTGWTHIIPGRSSWRILFYNSVTGAAALDFDPSREIFAAGAFSTGWTHIVNSPLDFGRDAILFYNVNTMSGAIGILGEDGFQTIRSYPPGSFSPWTHVIGLNSGFLFINSLTGAGAIGEIDGADFVTTKSYPPGSFSPGWTHILRTDNAALMEEMQAFCWPLSCAPGESLDFRASTAADAYSVTYVRFQNQDRTLVGATDIDNSRELIEVPVTNPRNYPGGMQRANLSPEEGCSDWETSWILTIPGGWRSGLYAAKCEDSAGAIFYVPFVVNPPANNRSSLAVIVNTTTWNAYNGWGGYSRYEVPGAGAWKFSYLRPNHNILNLSLTNPAYHYSSKHQARGELWILNWLEGEGYAFDVFTDLDLHDGIADLGDYRAILLSTHPEYWSIPMRNALDAFLEQGGNLLYLGGNGVYDAVDVSGDLTQITIYGTYGTGRTHLFRQPPISQPESRTLGVAFPWTPEGGDVGNNAFSRVAYRIVDPAHRFFRRTGLQANDLIGSQGWCIIEGAADLSAGGASGWECDLRDAYSPPNIQVLAEGTNPYPAAEMTYFDHPGGGFVFATGSMSFGGSLVVDTYLQQILRNVLAECV